MHKHLTNRMIDKAVTARADHNLALKTLFFYNGIFMLAATMLGPLYAVYVLENINGVTAVSVSWAAYLISTSLFTLAVGKLGDRVREKEYLLLASYSIRIASWLLFIFIDDIYSLVTVQILLGIAEALGTPAFNAIFAKHLDKDRYINEYSSWALIANFTSAIGVLLGGFVVKSLGFPYLFVIMSALAFISFLGILLKPRTLL